MQTRAESAVGSVKITGDPHGADLRTALRGYFSSRWSAPDSDAACTEKVDLAIERIVSAATEVLQPPTAVAR